MANSDYTVRSGNFGFCPVGFLASGITQLATSATMTGFTSSLSDGGIRIGMAAMIDDEIVVVTARSGNLLTLGRGCCDTIPAAHSTGAAIWFFDDSIASDDIEYIGTETISVKALPRTSSGKAVPIEFSPPNVIPFGLRFARPYPPGNVTINGSPFTSGATLSAGSPTLTITWAHRNRVTQQDTLVDHTGSSITPEAGTTYTMRVFKSGNVLVRTYSGITGTTQTYTLTTATSDFGTSYDNQSGRIELYSVRDGLDSFQRYDIPLTLVLPPQPYGLGYRLGQKLGTNTP